MPASDAPHLEIVIGIILFWLAIGALAIVRPFNPRAKSRSLFPLGAAGGIALAAGAYRT